MLSFFNWTYLKIYNIKCVLKVDQYFISMFYK